MPGRPGQARGWRLRGPRGRACDRPQGVVDENEHVHVGVPRGQLAACARAEQPDRVYAPTKLGMKLRHELFDQRRSSSLSGVSSIAAMV